MRSTEFTFGLTLLMHSFHQDWTNDAASEVEAVQNRLWLGSDPREVMLLRGDAQRLLEHLSSEAIERLWNSGVCGGWDLNFFGRGVESGSEWMRMIVEQCDSWLSRNEHQTVQLSDADMDDGFAHIRPIRDEVTRSVDVLGTELVSVLDECARSCSPELAFRVLLQALVNMGGKWITLTQYERMREIGVQLHYGEFVISDIEHVVLNPYAEIVNILRSPERNGLSTFGEYVAYLRGIDEASPQRLLVDFGFWLACKYEERLNLTFRDKVGMPWDDIILKVVRRDSANAPSNEVLRSSSVSTEVLRLLFDELNTYVMERHGRTLEDPFRSRMVIES